MECNCNNNNSNGGVIPWVRGNRLPLIICVYENVVTQEQVGDSTLTVNEMTRVPYEIQDNDTVTVIMKSGFRQVAMPFTTDGNKVMVTDNGELPTGAYTVEVTIERGDGARGRWQETRQVRIYENTSDAQLGEMYSIDADLFFYAKGDTGTGIADITNNPDGTLTITMTDGTSYVTEALKGDKGDKGDTGERGVSIVAFDVTGQTDVSVIYTVTFSDDTTQDISVPKGPQGDTGLTGNGISTTTLNSDYTLTIAYTDGTTYTTPSIRGAQGAQGVSVIGFTQTGETATNTMYNLVFSDGRTQSVAIPKGTKGDKGDTGNPGPQGEQGPKGDTVTATDYTLYNAQGGSSEGAMSQDAITKAISAQTGYYTCGTAAGTAAKVVTVESGNLYKRTLGGHFKVKMTNANTASGVTLQVGSETAAALWYNGAAVSASNTWDTEEVISVYYDGTYYQASNAQGGGGKAEKIKYDNSQSGLAAENVQEALDEMNNELLNIDLDETSPRVLKVCDADDNSIVELEAKTKVTKNGVLFLQDEEGNQTFSSEDITSRIEALEEGGGGGDTPTPTPTPTPSEGAVTLVRNNTLWPIWAPSDVVAEYPVTLGPQSDNYATCIIDLTYEEFLAKYYDIFLRKTALYTVTKKPIGLDCTEDYYLYEYDFCPKYYTRTVLISAGMNACEVGAEWGLAKFMECIINKNGQDGGLAYLYANVRFKILPVICPASFNSSPMKYLTVDGININNDWKWKGYGSDSGVETRLLKKWVTDNRKECDVWIDCHQAAYTVTTSTLFYGVVSDAESGFLIAPQKSLIGTYYNGYAGGYPISNENSYRKHAWAWNELGIRSMMIEQYPSNSLFGDTTLNNDVGDITNYVVMLRAYTLALLQADAVEFDTNSMMLHIFQLVKNKMGKEFINRGTTFLYGALQSASGLPNGSNPTQRLCTHYIPVESNSSINITFGGGYSIVEYYEFDEDKTMIAGPASSLPFTTSATTKYITFSFKKDVVDANEVLVNNYVTVTQNGVNIDF